VVRLLRLDQKIGSGVPMSLKLNVLNTDVTLFQNRRSSLLNFKADSPRKSGAGFVLRYVRTARCLRGPSGRRTPHAGHAPGSFEMKLFCSI
jgi:hypothetical protein